MAKKKSKRTARLPVILIIEGLSGADVVVEAAGAIARSISPWEVSRLDKIIEAGEFDGVLLTGGGDVSPALYGEEPSKEVYGVNETRDLVELIVLDRARELDIPVMGICRGAQIMAVAAGGSLIQHITGHRGGSHTVFTDRDALARKASKRASMKVVSLHHQEINDPGSLNITGWAQDGTVEIVESTDGRCLGVQFHPEMDDFADYSQNMFRWLVTEAASRAKLPTPAANWEFLYKDVSPWVSKYKTGNSCEAVRAPVTKVTTKVTPTVPVVKKPLTQVSAWAAKNAEKKELALPAGRGVLLRAPKANDNTVYVSFLCPECGLRFDKLEDREDHVSDQVCQLRLPEPAKELVMASSAQRSTAAAIASPKSDEDRMWRKIAGLAGSLMGW